MNMLKFAAAFAVAVIVAEPAIAAETVDKVPLHTSYLLNTLLLLMCGAMVMFMAAGFTMLEAGSVRAKSVAVILTKNIGLYSIAGICFYLVGYRLMFQGGIAELFNHAFLWTPDDGAVITGDFSSGQASNAFWFFQMAFVATAASVVSGTVAERIKLWPFFVFVGVLTAVIYPVVGSWTWGGGWLSSHGFVDFAGSTIVHSVGGWAALAGAVLLGARRGRFGRNGQVNTLPGASAPQVAIGVFILWFGWFGFNGGSQLAFGTATDAVAVANIFANTNAAAAGGVVVALIASQMLRGKADLTLTMNGALAGLVAITAEPVSPTIGQSLFIGASGSIVMMAGTRLLEILRVDDVVGAIPVHLFAGIWGTCAVTFTNDSADLATQLLGILSVGAFVLGISLTVWFVLKTSIGIRLCWRDESSGGDAAEMGVRAYNLDMEVLPHPQKSQS